MRFERGELATKREGASHRSQTRVVGYSVVWPRDGVSEYAVRDILRRHPSVHRFGTDSGFAWWEGNPGPDLRASKREVLAFTGGRSVGDAQLSDALAALDFP
jgi:hypothetical protein